MLLAEELALVAINPDTGRHALGTREQLNACLAGLLVAELLLDGAAAWGAAKDHVVLVEERQFASPTLAVAARVVAEKGPKLRPVLSHMCRGLEDQLGHSTWETMVSGLVQAGALAPTTRGLRPHNEVLDASSRDAVIARLRAAAESDGPVEPRTAALLNMTGPAHLLEVVAPDRSARKHARRRIDHALDGTAFAELGKVVRKILADAEAIGGAAAAGGAVAASS